MEDVITHTHMHAHAHTHTRTHTHTHTHTHARKHTHTHKAQTQFKIVHQMNHYNIIVNGLLIAITSCRMSNQQWRVTTHMY